MSGAMQSEQQSGSGGKIKRRKLSLSSFILSGRQDSNLRTSRLKSG